MMVHGGSWWNVPEVTVNHHGGHSHQQGSILSGPWGCLLLSLQDPWGPFGPY